MYLMLVLRKFSITIRTRKKLIVCALGLHETYVTNI